MRGYSIDIMKDPFEPTDFKKGEIVGLGDATALVVGEDDIYLHTFIITGEQKGSYHGVRKLEKNLTSLRRL